VTTPAPGTVGSTIVPYGASPTQVIPGGSSAQPGQPLPGQPGYVTPGTTPNGVVGVPTTQDPSLTGAAPVSADSGTSVGTAAGSYDQNATTAGGGNATHTWTWLLLLVIVGGVAYYFIHNRQDHEPDGGSRGGQGGAV
jgi:hypothetical protein